QPELERSDAAPGAEKVSRLQAFRRGWRRRMVRGDEIDRAGRERVPELLAIGPRSNWRGALEGGGAVGDLLGGEEQIVRTRVNADGHARAARRAQYRDGGRRREMNDVHGRAMGPAQLQQQVDGGLLGGRRTRCEIRAVSTPPV